MLNIKTPCKYLILCALKLGLGVALSIVALLLRVLVAVVGAVVVAVAQVNARDAVPVVAREQVAKARLLIVVALKIVNVKLQLQFTSNAFYRSKR